MDLELLASILAPHGRLDAAQAEELRRGIRLWLLAGGTMSLHQALRLPPTPARLGRTLRDAQIAAVVELLAGATVRDRARALRHHLQRYNAFQRAAWAGLHQAPDHASPIERAIHAAALADPRPWPATVNGCEAWLQRLEPSTNLSGRFDALPTTMRATTEEPIHVAAP